MKIKDLPEPIRSLAESRFDPSWHPSVEPYFMNNNELNVAFDWSRTPEGSDFWYKINQGDYEPFKGLYKSESLRETTLPELIEKNSEVKPIKKDGGGLRYNEGKLRYDLLHPVATEGIVKVLTKGAKKYEPRNWERGMSWTSVLSSMKRHIAAFEQGEDFDPETGCLHMDHVQCNAHFISAFYKIYPQGDDRRHHYLDVPKIGLDIDEVLCDWVGDWTAMRELPRPTSWYFDRELIEKFEEMESQNKLDEFYLSLQPLISPEDIPFEPHCYITSRPVDTKVTEEWLADHGFPARPVFTTNVEKTKVDIAKEQGVEIFVDDSFDNFKALNEAGITCFLMDAPHNQRYNVGFKRIKSLKQLV